MKQATKAPDFDPVVDERSRREEAEDWATIDRLRERNPDEDPDQVMAVVTEVVEEVRREMYAEEQGTAAGRR